MARSPGIPVRLELPPAVSSLPSQLIPSLNPGVGSPLGPLGGPAPPGGGPFSVSPKPAAGASAANKECATTPGGAPAGAAPGAPAGKTFGDP